MLKSLKSQLLVFWLMLVLLLLALLVMMFLLVRNSAGVIIEEAQTSTANSCSAIALRYARSLPEPAPASPKIDLLNVLLRLVLIGQPHVEGGVWQTDGGFLAYAYPTYEGSSDKHDVPQAEQAHIEELARVAARTRRVETDTVRGAREALILSACPLQSADQSLVAWTMTRTSAAALAARDDLRFLLGGLLLIIVVAGIWLGTIWQRGLRHVNRLEAAMAETPGDESAPALELTGVTELDRMVNGFNQLRQRFETTQARLRDATLRMAHEQRLATLGRMTGGIAHEIRNPIATMRLKAENALAAPPERQAAALEVILEQIARLDRLVQSLLAVVQPLQLQSRSFELKPWMAEHADAIATRAATRGVALKVSCDDVTVNADPLHLGRAVDNLLDNAVRHTPTGGTVSLSGIRPDATHVVIRVDDDGPGIEPAVRSRLFEPFSTGRADGTGLGLALAREVATAHGGELRHVALDHGSRFELELPWQAS